MADTTKINVRLEEVLLATIIKDPNCASTFREQWEHIKPYYHLFGKEIHNVILEVILDFYREYHSTPSYEALIAHSNSASGDPVFRNCLQQIINTEPDILGFQAILAQVINQAILRRSADVILKCAESIEKEGDIDQLEKLTHHLSEIISTRRSGEKIINAGYWHDGDWIQDYRTYISEQGTSVKLNLGTLTERIGPVSYGEMVSIYGAVNHGKSFLLGHLGWDLFCHQNMHVVHVTLETARRFVEWRYTARALRELGVESVGFNDFRSGNITEHQLKWMKDVTRLFSTDGSLLILDIPEQYATIDALTAIILEEHKDKPVDIILIDYATLMRLSASRYHSNDPYDWKTVGVLAKDLRDNLARSRVLINSAGEKGTILITASQLSPESINQTLSRFMREVKATDVGLSYLYSQPVDFGIHIRREHDYRFMENVEEDPFRENAPEDLLLLVLTKSRYTGGLGSRCWFRPDWENWVLGSPLSHSEVQESLGLTE